MAYPMGHVPEAEFIDVSGKRRHASFVGGNFLTFWSREEVGWAANFDGSTTYMSIGGTAIGNAFDGKFFSLTALINPLNSGTEFARIGDRAYDGQWACYINEIGPYLGMAVSADGGDSDGAFEAATVTYGVWQHVCFTYDGVSKKAYVNGILKEVVATGLGPLGTSTDTIRIGQRVDAGSNRFFEGKMANWTIWNRALTDSEVLRDSVNSFGKFRVPRLNRKRR